MTFVKIVKWFGSTRLGVPIQGSRAQDPAHPAKAHSVADPNHQLVLPTCGIVQSLCSCARRCRCVGVHSSHTHIRHMQGYQQESPSHNLPPLCSPNLRTGPGQQHPLGVQQQHRRRVWLLLQLHSHADPHLTLTRHPHADQRHVSPHHTHRDWLLRQPNRKQRHLGATVCTVTSATATQLVCSVPNSAMAGLQTVRRGSVGWCWVLGHTHLSKTSISNTCIKHLPLWFGFRSSKMIRMGQCSLSAVQCWVQQCTRPIGVFSGGKTA